MSPGSDPRRRFKWNRGAAALAAAGAIAAAVGGAAAMIAGNVRAAARAEGAAAIADLGRTANLIAIQVMQKLFNEERIVQRPFRNRPLRWDPANLTNGFPGVAAATVGWNWAGGTNPRLDLLMCNPLGLGPTELGNVMAGNQQPPHPTNCNNFARAMAPQIPAPTTALNVVNDFVNNRYTATATSVTRLLNPTTNLLVGYRATAEFNLRPPQPFCELSPTGSAIKEGENVTITAETVLGVTAAQWEVPNNVNPSGTLPSPPQGQSRTFTFPIPGNYTINFRVTGVPGATPPQGIGVFPATNPPQAICRAQVNVAPKPCRFTDRNYQEPFNYPGMGVRPFGRNINTMNNGVQCSSWGNCNSRGIYSYDIPKNFNFGGVANWNWLPGSCRAAVNQCVNIHLGCACNTPIASMMIRDMNKSTCYVTFIMWRPPGGCFAPDTPIEKADGTWARADELRPGDVVWNPVRRQAAVIQRVYRGPERVPLYEVQVGDRVIRVTSLHTFLTERGVVQARDLLGEDRVKLADGSWERILSLQTVRPDEDQQVWNFDLEGDGGTAEDHVVSAAGIVSGDMVLQRKVAAQ